MDSKRKILNIIKFVIELILLIILFYLIYFKKYSPFLALVILPIISDVIVFIILPESHISEKSTNTNIETINEATNEDVTTKK